MKTYIINPDTHKPVTIEEWRKDENPTRANLLLLDTGSYKLLMGKSYIAGQYTFDQAQEVCAAMNPEGFDDLSLRCPTRKECIDIYDARFIGDLDAAVDLVGGDICKNCKWTWTCEKDADPNFNDLAWLFLGNSGGLGLSYVTHAFQVQGVALL